MEDEQNRVKVIAMEQDEKIQVRKRRIEHRAVESKKEEEIANKNKQAKILAETATAEATVQAASAGSSAAVATLLDPPPAAPMVPTTGAAEGAGAGTKKE